MYKGWCDLPRIDVQKQECEAIECEIYRIETPSAFFSKTATKREISKFVRIQRADIKRVFSEDFQDMVEGRTLGVLHDFHLLDAEEDGKRRVQLSVEFCLLTDDDVTEIKRNRKAIEMSKPQHKPTIILDFDGVLHAYKGWKGPMHFEDEMVRGAREALADYVEHFNVAIYSTRSHDPEAKEALKTWMENRLAPGVFTKLQFVDKKVPASLLIDDRGFHFEGTFPSVEFIQNFQPWWKR